MPLKADAESGKRKEAENYLTVLPKTALSGF